MSTTPRPKPYTLDLTGSQSADELKDRLANLFENADTMFQELYTDLAGVADDVVAGSSSTTTVTSTGPTTAQVLTRVLHGI